MIAFTHPNRVEKTIDSFINEIFDRTEYKSNKVTKVNTKTGYKVLVDLTSYDYKKEDINKIENHTVQSGYNKKTHVLSIQIKDYLFGNLKTELPEYKTIDEEKTIAKFEDGLLEIQFYYKEVDNSEKPNSIKIS